MLLSCNNQDKNTKIISGENKTVIAPADDDDKNSISNLETKYKKEIGGLWKLYKTIWSDGSSSIEEDNSFIEIKSDKMFSEKNRTGYWFLSFCKDSSGIGALFTKLQPISNTEVKVTVSRIDKTVDNGTTYLKLTLLTDGRQSFYIRQQ